MPNRASSLDEVDEIADGVVQIIEGFSRLGDVVVGRAAQRVSLSFQSAHELAELETAGGRDRFRVCQTGRVQQLNLGEYSGWQYIE